MNDLHEKLRADMPGESPAVLRERAKMAREEAVAAKQAAGIARRATLDIQTLWLHQPIPVSKESWDEILRACDEAFEMANVYALDCRDRANELDEQAEEASLSPDSRRLLHAEGQ